VAFEIKGRAASPGVYRGVARILTDQRNFGRLRKGEVAVSHTASPELVLVLDRAGAVVTDIGGVLSHLVVVARGLGVPAVVATDNASARIPDGAIITVDGSTGKVTVQTTGAARRSVSGQ